MSSQAPSDGPYSLTNDKAATAWSIRTLPTASKYALSSILSNSAVAASARLILLIIKPHCRHVRVDKPEIIFLSVNRSLRQAGQLVINYGASRKQRIRTDN